MSFRPKLRELAIERLQLYADHLLEPKNQENILFGNIFFKTKFKSLIKSQIPSIADIFINEIKSFSGNNLLGKDDIVFKIENEDNFLFEIVSEDNENKATIYIGCKAFFYIDLLTAAFEDTPSESNFEIHSSSVLSIVEAIHLKPEVIINLIKSLEKIAVSYSKNSEPKTNYNIYKMTSWEFWSEKSGLSIFFLLSHEYSHYVCGHIGFYKNQYIKETNLQDDISYINYIWPAELMADSYATMRLLYSILIETNSQRPKEQSESSYINMIIYTARIGLSACIIPIILLKAEETNRNIRNKSSYKHPNTLTRMFGIFASADFFMRPLYSLFQDIRDNPARKILSDANLEHDYYGLYACYTDCIFAYIGMLGELELDENAFSNVRFNSYLDVEFLLKRIVCARGGLTNSIGFDKNINHHITLAISIWGKCMRNLCTKVNGHYAFYIKDEFISKSLSNEKYDFHPEFLKEENDLDNPIFIDMLNHRGQIIDPVYKILNDWMGHIQACALYLSDDEIEKYEKTTGFHAMLAFRKYCTA